jgi:peptide/nickel transport system substrate-binding protein
LPDTFNPGQATLAESYVLFRLVYDSMYEYNADGTFSLELADSATTSDDGLVWTFKIRDGVKWHDGQPLTAEDVVFTYRFYATHQEFPYMPGYTANFADVQSTPNNEVVITLFAPVSNMDALLFDMFILPAHIWGGMSFDDAAAFDNAAMIGSGPFKFVSNDGDIIHLEATKDHYLYTPSIDAIDFKYYKSDELLADAIINDEVDMLYQVPFNQVARLKQAENVEVVTGAPTAPGVSDIIPNQLSEDNCALGMVCSGHPALRDRDVRLALAHAIDKQKIIDTVVLGLGTPGVTLIPSGLGDFFNDQLKDYAYDVNEANKILDENGYLDIDGDGIREMPDGSTSLKFRLTWPNDIATATSEANLLKEMWSKIGVDITLESIPSDELADRALVYDYDLLIWAWGSDPDPELLLSVPTTDGIESGLNETGYSNPQYDALYLQQQVAGSREERRQIVWKMQEIMLRDVVYIIPFYDVQVQAHRTDRFTGWLTNSTTLSLERLSNIISLKPVQ